MECDVPMDKEILELLQDIQNNINKRFDIIEAGQEELKASQKETNKRLDTLEKGQKEITSRLDELSKGIGKLVADEIGESISSLKEDIASIKDDMENVKESLGTLENVTRNNCYDIASLRKAK